MADLKRILIWATLFVVVGGGVAYGWSSKAREAAREAEQKAAVATERARNDSVQAAEARRAYDALQVRATARTDSLAALASQLQATERQRAQERVRHRMSLDSLSRSVLDTATVVARPVFDAVVASADSALSAAEAENGNLRRQLGVAQTEAESYRVLWQRADSGWAVEAAAAQTARDALAAQTEAMERWKRVSNPPLLVKIGKEALKGAVWFTAGYVLNEAIEGAF